MTKLSFVLYAHWARQICAAQIATCLVGIEKYIISTGSKPGRHGSWTPCRIACSVHGTCQAWINSVLCFIPMICRSTLRVNAFGVYGLKFVSVKTLQSIFFQFEMYACMYQWIVTIAKYLMSALSILNIHFNLLFTNGLSNLHYRYCFKRVFKLTVNRYAI